MKKYIKWMIYFLLFLIILVVILLIINYKGTDVNNVEDKQVEDNVQDRINVSTFSSVENTNDYFIVKNIIDRYLKYIRNLNGDSYINENSLKVSKSEAIKSEQEEAVKFFLNVLDEDYKEEFNISEDSIINETEKYVQQGDYSKSDIIYNLNFNEMYEYKYTDNITLFLVSADISNINLELLIKFDNTNNTYSIFLSDYIEKYNYNIDIKKDNINISENSLDDNTYNKLITGTITDEDMSKEYFNVQKNNLLYDLKKEYSNLNNEYKEKKFPDYADFEKYFSTLQSDLLNAKLAKYSVEHLDNHDIYTLVDNNGRYYIIENSEGLVNYSVKLDDYTIMTDRFKEVYNKANEQEKVILNINKIMMAINEKDYKYVYSQLADSFKNNHFANENQLKDYLEQKVFAKNEVSYQIFSIEGNVYTYELELTNADQSVEEELTGITMNVVMQLKEGTDFVMSFSIE